MNNVSKNKMVNKFKFNETKRNMFNIARSTLINFLPKARVYANSKLTSSQIGFKLLSTNAPKTVNIFFVDRDGDKVAAKAKIGTNLLDVALDNNIGK